MTHLRSSRRMNLVACAAATVFATAALALAASGRAEAAVTVDADLGICYVAGTDRTITASDKAMLVWESDGDLVLYAANSSQELWSTGTAGVRRELCIGSDGAMWIDDYDTGAVYWRRTPSGTGTVTSIDIDDDCDLEAVTSSGTALWTVSGTCPGDADQTLFDGWCADKTEKVVVLENDKAELRWQTDGNLAMYANGADDGEYMWSAWTSSPQGNKLCFEDGGKLVIYNSAGTAVWSMGTAGSTADQYTLGLDACDVVVTDWTTGTASYTKSSTCPQSTEAASWTKSTTYTGTTPDEQVILENDDAELVYDGRLVLRSKDGDVFWTSSTSYGGRLVFQTDGNLVIYQTATGTSTYWASGTTGSSAGATLSLDGCRFTIQTSSGTTVFTKGNTSCSLSSLSFDGTSDTRSGDEFLLRTDESYLRWQSDGNLCLYTTGGTYLWCAGTGNNSGKTLNLLSSGYLKINNASGTTVYSVGSGIATKLKLSGCTLTVVGTLVFGATATIATLNSSCTVASYSYEKTEGNSTFGVDFSTALTATAGSTDKLNTVAKVLLTIFTYDVTLFETSAYQTQLDNGANLTTASVEVLGDSMDINLTFEMEFFEKTKTFTIGVVPVVVSAGASGSLKLGVSAGAGTLSVTPATGLYATVSAGIGGGSEAAGASAGLRGELTLLESSVPISLKIFQSSGAWKYTVSGSLVTQFLGGTLSLYAEAYVKVLLVKVSLEWTYKLFSWTGVKLTKTLFSSTGSF